MQYRPRGHFWAQLIRVQVWHLKSLDILTFYQEGPVDNSCTSLILPGPQNGTRVNLCESPEEGANNGNAKIVVEYRPIHGAGAHETS